MKITMSRVSAVLLTLVASSALFAEMGTVLHVSIPFDFVVAGVPMPAGDYSVEESGGGGAIVLHNVASHKSAIVVSEPGSLRSKDLAPGLTFERRGSEVYLARVFGGGSTPRVLNLPLK